LSRTIGREVVQGIDVASEIRLPYGASTVARIAIRSRAVEIAVGELDRAGTRLKAIGTSPVVGRAIEREELRNGRRLSESASSDREERNANEKWLHGFNPPGAVRTVESELGEFSSNRVWEDITYFSNVWSILKKQVI
jgi:hypothetical protein